MPRDANGNYALPSGNPVVTQTDISSVWANDTMSDLGTEMTDSLSRSGKGGMTGPFPIVDKSGNIPGLSFAAEPTSGILREAAGDMRAQVQGVSKMRWTAAGDAEVYRDATWQPVATQPTGQKAMSGVGGTSVIYFYNAAVPPVGWTLANPDANARNLTVGGTGGTIGGSDDPTNMSDSVNVSISGTTGSTSVDSHRHGPGTIAVSTPPQGDENCLLGAGASVARQAHTHNLSGTTSFVIEGSTNHSHSFSDSGSGTASFQPRHAMGVLALLNA